jgi:mercuric ion transport protein
MRDRSLIAAGVVAVAAAVCCATPLLVMTVAALGSTAWLAKADTALIPVLILGVGLTGFVLYRKQRRER